MTFANRFDLLMRLSNTSNNAIAKYLAMDPSYISRLRRGERNRPRHQDYIVSICTFFARQLLNGKGLQNFAESVADPSVVSIQDPKELAAYLENWILVDSAGAGEQREDNRPPETVAPSIVPYYGINGRYQAMVALLANALEALPSFTLLMYSDESTESPQGQCDLHAKWNTLLQEAIHQGNRVKIILKTSRNMDEMFNSVSYWLPLYGSGIVDAYYYPRLRDGVYKRVLYVIPGFAAVFSTAIGAFGENVSTFFVSDPTTVDSFSDEFYSYLALCNPLMEKWNLKSKLSEGSKSPCIVSFHQDWLFQGKQFPTAFLQSLLSAPQPPHVTLVLYVQDIAAISERLEKRNPVIPPDSLPGCRDFLQVLLALLQTQTNFSITLSEFSLGSHSCAAYENGCALLLKQNQPTEALVIREGHVASTVWEILARASDAVAHKYLHSAAVAEQLHALLLQIQSLLP